MRKDIPTVVITKMSPRWTYFQIYILGLYELERLGEIRLRFQCDWYYRLSTILPNIPYLRGELHRLARRNIIDSYITEGYVAYNGKRRSFCIDSADSPYLFVSEALERVDVYFKAQCPKEINPTKGFRLLDDVFIEYCDYKIDAQGQRVPLQNLSKNLSKISPLVVGFRRLSYMNSYRSLRKGWENYKNNVYKGHLRKAMCYFGNAFGPKPTFKVPCDVDDEGNIMGVYSSLNHPNEKRSKIASIMQTLGKEYDARIISDGNADSQEGVLFHKELVVPIKKFCYHISHFQYNYNISGYRMSIPNRFMESFIVGTAIVTDKLAVKWYLPFDDEVFETEEMGYLPIDKINWDKVRQDLINLPAVSKEKVLGNYYRKWGPIPVARYMIKTIIKIKNS